jgi:hypothetical protein
MCLLAKEFQEREKFALNGLSVLLAKQSKSKKKRESLSLN